MMAAIETIMIKERIRKDISKISDLAEDIGRNGLINPVTVMALDGGGYQLLAGLRRIRAVQSLGLAEIEVNVVLPADAEAALRIEISENEQRVDFTFSEKMDFAGLLEDIEKAKAKERMLAGKSASDPVDARPQGQGKSRDAIGGMIGMSGRQYDRAKYIVENAPEEAIEKLDSGQDTIYGVHKDLRAKAKAGATVPALGSGSEGDAPPKKGNTCEVAQQANASPPLKVNPHTPGRVSEVSEEEQMKYLSARDKEELRRRKEFSALSPEGKIADLERQLFDMRVRAHSAEADLDTLKYEYGIKADHKDSIIDSLKRQVADLSEALEAAEKKIAELENSGSDEEESK